MKTPLHVLIAEDSTSDAELILRELRQSGFAPEWVRVESEGAYVEGLHAGIDIVLSDYQMPQFSGPRALELLNASGLDIPFIIVSGTIGEDIAVEVMRLGASDYLIKDRLTRLGPAVSHAMDEARLRRERKVVEDSLRASQAMMATAQEIGHFGSWECELTGARELRWSDEMFRIAGYEPGAVAMNEGLFFGLVHPDDQEAIREAVAVAIRERGAYSIVHRLVRPGGEERIVHEMAHIFYDDEGMPLRMVGTAHDITERRKLELQALRSQRMESIGTLAAGIAHDLNNILAPIMMSVPLLRMEMTAEAREDVIATVEMSAERGAQIVKQVLTFGRGVEGVKCPLQIGKVIQEIVAIMHGTFPKDISVHSKTQPGLWPILGDATQMHQVLLNLCINARDAMPEGGKLCVSVRNLMVDGNYSSMVPGITAGPYVVLEVSDTGSGIPAEIMERIFDPFFTTKSIGQGTGLGLSSVLGIVKNHGGHVNVTSVPGKGTTFQIFLPAAIDTVVAPNHSGPPQCPPSGNGEVILVVDDEESVRGAVRTVLGAYGYRTLQAADGTEALAVFAQNSSSISLVLTDLMMPHMGGVTLMRALHAMKPSLPVIASTGLGKKANLAALREMKIETVLSKPYNADTLLRAVQEVLHPAAGGPQNTASV